MSVKSKFPFTPFSLLGLSLVFFSSLVDEYVGLKLVFYLMIGVGALLFGIEILGHFKNSDAKYLADLEKIKKRGK